MNNDDDDDTLLAHVCREYLVHPEPYFRRSHDQINICRPVDFALRRSGLRIFHPAGDGCLQRRRERHRGRSRRLEGGGHNERRRPYKLPTNHCKISPLVAHIALSRARQTLDRFLYYRRSIRLEKSLLMFDILVAGKIIPT